MDPRRQDATCADVDEENQTAAAVTCCAPARAALQDLTRPIDVGDFGVRRRTRGGGGGGGDEGAAFGAWPFLGPLLFENQTSDCRDHCANERTFLSYLRLAMFMALVSSAIVMSFHLKNEPSAIELRMAKPLGLVFWALSVACLALGLANYISTCTTKPNNRPARCHATTDDIIPCRTNFSHLTLTCLFLFFFNTQGP
ncbi:hypothetical protein RB598_001621 [Gaeumannomyces tritici]